MMKKLLFIPLITIFLFAGAVQAQTTNDLPEPGMLPDSPFYFLKSWSENIGTFFTFDDVAKAERFLDLSEKRLAEANALVDKGKLEVAEKTIERYQEQFNTALAKAEEAKAKDFDTDEVLAKASEATLKHQMVLADVYEKVPEQAKSAIERAMEKSMRGHEEALKAISGQKREEAMQRVEEKRQEVEQRLEGLRDKGTSTPTIPSKEEIEQKIPARPETEKPETPGQPQAQEEREVEEIETEKPETPGQPQAQEEREVEEIETEKQEIPEVKTETPGGADKPDTEKPETPEGQP